MCVCAHHGRDPSFHSLDCAWLLPIAQSGAALGVMNEYHLETAVAGARAVGDKTNKRTHTRTKWRLLVECRQAMICQDRLLTDCRKVGMRGHVCFVLCVRTGPSASPPAHTQPTLQQKRSFFFTTKFPTMKHNDLPSQARDTTICQAKLGTEACTKQVNLTFKQREGARECVCVPSGSVRTGPYRDRSAVAILRLPHLLALAIRIHTQRPADTEQKQ